MKLASVQAIMRALVSAEVRFLVAGGVAVNVYGLRRFTADLDLVVQLVPDNLRAAFEALAALGYQPGVPLSAEQFADSKLRQQLCREQGMKVLQLWSDVHRETPIDIFVTEPFPFDEEYDRATVRDLSGAGSIRVVSIPTLIAMKREANRDQDQTDIHHLELILRDR